MVNFATEAASLLPDQQELSDQRHADPEMGLELPRSQTKVSAALGACLPLEITTHKATTSLMAVPKGAHADRPAEEAPSLLGLLLQRLLLALLFRSIARPETDVSGSL